MILCGKGGYAGMASLQARSDREGAQDGGESCSLIDTMVQKLKFNPKHYLQPNVRTVHSILREWFEREVLLTIKE